MCRMNKFTLLRAGIFVFLLSHKWIVSSPRCNKKCNKYSYIALSWASVCSEVLEHHLLIVYWQSLTRYCNSLKKLVSTVQIGPHWFTKELHLSYLEREKMEDIWDWVMRTGLVQHETCEDYQDWFLSISYKINFHNSWSKNKGRSYRKGA